LTSESHPLSMICSWACLPSSSATRLAHATKVTELGCTPSCCFCQAISSVFCPWLHFTCPNIKAVEVTTSRDGILLNTLWASSMLPHLAYMSTRLHPTKTWPSHPLWIYLSMSPSARFKCS
jgi:hypothetical protein